MASPRTNFDAPSIEPKKELSSSSSRRRCWATFSSISPADRSASIAICLPGMASRVKRAPTSAMRVAPLVMTKKLMVTRMRKTMMPMTKSPPITKLAKPPSLRTVATSSTVGKAENSSGLLIHRATIRINTDNAIENARPRSISVAGTGRKNRHRISTMPTAKAMSLPPRPTAGTLAAAVNDIPGSPQRFDGDHARRSLRGSRRRGAAAARRRLTKSPRVTFCARHGGPPTPTQPPNDISDGPDAET